MSSARAIASGISQPVSADPSAAKATTASTEGRRDVRDVPRERLDRGDDGACIGLLLWSGASGLNARGRKQVYPPFATRVPQRGGRRPARGFSQRRARSSAFEG